MFEGKTVFCVGSGPSLTKKDCAAIEKTGSPIIAVNSSWQAVPSASILFAGDEAWWTANLSQLNTRAALWTTSMSASLKYNLRLFKSSGRHWNSGLRAIELAESLGAEKVVLLGYDCSVRRGAHWHGKHDKTLNPTSGVCQSWIAQFKQLSQRVKVPVINCSRETVLTCFPQVNLEDILCLKLSPEEPHPKMNLSYAAL